MVSSGGAVVFEGVRGTHKDVAAETRRVVVARRLRVSKGLEDRVRIQNLLREVVL